MHRYIFHHIFLANGMKAVIGIVCQPHTCSRYCGNPNYELSRTEICVANVIPPCEWCKSGEFFCVQNLG